MSESMEFQGKNLDEAIEAACRHFDLKRDKLEIEIVSGGSSGIFGLVGVKKAVVRAKPRGAFKTALEPERRPERPERSERSERSERPERTEKPARPEKSERPAKAEAKREDVESAHAPDAPADEARPRQAPQPAEADAPAEDGEPRRGGRRGRGRGRTERTGERSGERTGERSGERTGQRGASERQPDKADRADRPADGEAGRSRTRRERPRRDSDAPRAQAPRRDEAAGGFGEDEDSGAPRGIDHLDQALLEQVTREVMGKLLEQLVENASVSVELKPDRVCVRIEDPENSGLLIGREGQTLASIQYLANRLVSRRMDASVRVQIDAGDYRENQDERLRQIARHLADKAMSTGRTQSTRPMSSYHRRVVHLTLQDDEHVFTRSKGEGSMKRVLIMTKRKGKDGEMLEEIPQDAAQEFRDNAED